MKKIYLLVVTLVLLGSLGFIYQTSMRKTSVFQSQPSSNLEEFLTANQVSEDIAAAYRFALENPQNVLSIVKCYCGCLKQDHTNNRDCFMNEDGSFDLMGLNCGLCVKTALTAKQMLAEGKSVQEISDYVDYRWGDLE